MSSTRSCVGWNVLRMPNHHLLKRVLFSMPNSRWRKQRGGQPLTYQRSMKEITKRLGAWKAKIRYVLKNNISYKPCAICTLVAAATLSITGKREPGTYNQTLDAKACSVCSEIG
ncbi:hypothetical protein T265_10189 [Opisthorchis viverrini]|uniref:Uncharacterized protein n=1 Tax=Opisthorchis viverrini TaxID=6198 RepID=A0A075A272_OPIVI|nr:hypothetical protein T265_10189 [Opisthorchis viverrini]KER21499.1 hypothetical protein T265_10189 [Opisthorchis viverrini]